MNSSYGAVIRRLLMDIELLRNKCYENIKIGIVDINTIVVGRENFRKFGIEKIKEIVSLNDFEYKGEKIVRF